jgi:hypothetical protein
MTASAAKAFQLVNSCFTVKRGGLNTYATNGPLTRMPQSEAQHTTDCAIMSICLTSQLHVTLKRSIHEKLEHDLKHYIHKKW